MRRISVNEWLMPTDEKEQITTNLSKGLTVIIGGKEVTTLNHVFASIGQGKWRFWFK